MVTLADVLRLAFPAEARVLAGRGRLDHPVRWARQIGTRSSPSVQLESGELLLLSLERATARLDERALLLLMSDLANAGAAGLCCAGTIPLRAIEYADAHSLPLVLLPDGADVSELERRTIALVIDREAAMRARVEEIQEQLLAKLVEDIGVRPLLDVLASATAKGVLALDEYLHASGSAGLGEDEQAPLVEELRPALNEFWDRASRARPLRTLRLPVTRGRALVLPLLLKGTPVGALCLVGPIESFSDFDDRLVTRAAAVLVLELAKQRAISAAQLRLQGDFLVDLLSGQFPSEEAMRARANWMGHDLTPPHLVLSVALDPMPGDADREQHYRARLSDSGWLASILGRRGALALARDTRLSVLLPLDEAVDRARVRAAVDALRGELVDALGADASISAGVGNYAPGLAQLARMQEEADRALVVAQTLFGGDSTALHVELGAARLLSELLGNPVLDVYYQDHLGKLVDYDRRHNADLLNTLGVFFDAGSNHVRAARLLHLHRNTLLYRLDRIRSILGVDLDDAPTCLALQLAMALKHVGSRAPHQLPTSKRVSASTSSPERSAS
jgi:PucR family transcriptional regulator, purine catabolism regulatory protein